MDVRADADWAAMDERLASNRRGICVSLAVIAESSGLAGLTTVLRVPAASDAVMANSIVVRTVLERGFPVVRLHGRGADNFRGAMWYSHIIYHSPSGETRSEIVRLVLRSVAGAPRAVVVMQRYRQVPARQDSVLSEYGCVPLAWDCPSLDAE